MIKALKTLEERRQQHAKVVRICDRLEQDGLEDEIFSEIASALGRTEKKLLSLLHDLNQLGTRIDVSQHERALVPMIDEFNRLRKQAQRALWELIVHREAIGATNHRELDRLYPIPAQQKAARPENPEVLHFPLCS